MYTIVSYKSYKRERVGFNHLKVHLKYFYTSEILNTAHFTLFFDKTISIKYSLPPNTNTNSYFVPKNRFKREYSRFLMNKYK